MTLKIGNAQGFWGDSSDAAAKLATLVPDLNYLTLDYLAEVSLSIMAIQREKDPSLGYARDFISVIESLLPLWEGGSKLKVVSNAGGLNPKGLAKALGDLPLKIAVVEGDDVLAQLQKNPENFPNFDTGESLTAISDRLVTANAYLGAEGIVKALDEGADIVITGRVADPSMVVAPSIHHYGWKEDEYNKIAGATVAGHLIECGRQVTGGISTDWLTLPDHSWIGFPIVEVAVDGSCIVTKAKGTGGAVNELIVKEQLLYEIGDPSCYLSPDVTVSFLDVEVKEIGEERVHVHGAKGTAPKETLKVSATYRDGWRSEGTLALFGKDVAEKAKATGEAILDQLELKPERSIIECIGAGDLVPGTTEPPKNLRECMLRIAVADPNKEIIEQFTKEIAPMVTAGAAGTTGYIGGRPKVRPIFGFWPCLISREVLSK